MGSDQKRFRAPFVGTRRKLVMAFDVGTTFSGVSYCVLDPGQIPEVKGVTKYPAHEQLSGASKIPTIIYYDQHGTPRAVGAEALTEGIYETAEEEGWYKTEWFKMHIRPRNEASSHITSRLPPLPPNKTVVQVFADFLTYLFKCASSYIIETHANGEDLWNSVKNDIEYVISHPNGWEGFQQQQIRQAVVLAGFVKDDEAGRARVRFVTEGEASLHFSIRNGLPEGAMKAGEGVVIVDAGGGTIDLSTYSRQIQNSKSGDNFEEIAAPQCHFFGSVFVTIAARLALQKLLEESDFIEDIDHIVRCFDRTTKIRFSDNNQAQYIKFGSTRDNDASVGIRFGQLKMTGEQVAACFEPSIKCIVDAIIAQMRSAHKSISHVILVGGFSSSDWLFTQVKERLAPHGLSVGRPDLFVNKAVSDGAVLFYLDHQVKTRVSKAAYGAWQAVPYDANNPEHVERQAKAYHLPSGRKVLPDSFSVMIPRNTQVSESTEFKKSYWRERATAEEIRKNGKISVDIWAYHGDSTKLALWWDHPLDRKKNPTASRNFKKLCTVTTDVSHIPVTPVNKLGGAAGTFVYVEYKLIIHFSAVELRAQLEWKESGELKRSEAKIIYDTE